MAQKHRVETVIIGGGQAGLAMSYWLTQRGRSHLVLERSAHVGYAWRYCRWDSFTLVTPNWSIRLPGGEYQGEHPDGFMSRDAVVTHLQSYVDLWRLPVCYGIRATQVELLADGQTYQVLAESTTELFEAANVVIATGLYQQPKVPQWCADLPVEIRQLSSAEYRSPEDLPAGAVLVVGSGQSGCQITEELYKSGRKVYLSVSGAGRVPRRYRGKDSFTWDYLSGSFDVTVDQLRSPRDKFEAHPHLSGRGGGHTLNLHQFARDGVTLLGRLRGVHGDRAVVAADLYESLARADRVESEFCDNVDEYIKRAKLDAPIDQLPQLHDGFEAKQLTDLEISAAGITTIIWATGFGFDFSIVNLPVFDGDGYPIQSRGITRYPGLYFVGLPWLHTGKSGILLGVGEDAAWIATHIEGRYSGHKHAATRVQREGAL